MSVVRESKSVTKKVPFFKYCLSIGMKRIKLESLKRMLRCISVLLGNFSTGAKRKRDLRAESRWNSLTTGRILFFSGVSDRLRVELQQEFERNSFQGLYPKCFYIFFVALLCAKKIACIRQPSAVISSQSNITLRLCTSAFLY